MVYSAAEVKTCGTFNNGKNRYLHATRLHPTVPQAPSNTPQNIQLNHRQILNSGMKPKRSKTWDIKWHWLRDK